MKKHIAVIVSVLALATIGLHAQTTNNATTNLAPVTLVAPPVARPIIRIAPVTLDAAHSAAFLASISAVVTLPAGTAPVSGGYRVSIVAGVPIVTIFGSVQPTAPVTTQ